MAYFLPHLKKNLLHIMQLSWKMKKSFIEKLFYRYVANYLQFEVMLLKLIMFSFAIFEIFELY